MKLDWSQKKKRNKLNRMNSKDYVNYMYNGQNPIRNLYHKMYVFSCTEEYNNFIQVHILLHCERKSQGATSGVNPGLFFRQSEFFNQYNYKDEQTDVASRGEWPPPPPGGEGGGGTHWYFGFWFLVLELLNVHHRCIDQFSFKNVISLCPPCLGGFQ